MGKEAGIVKKVIAAVQKRGGHAVKIYVDPAFGCVGEPDIHGCYLGHMLIIECKQPGEELTMIQKHRLMVWKRAGAKVLAADSVEVVEAMLDEIERETMAR